MQFKRFMIFIYFFFVLENLDNKAGNKPLPAIMLEILLLCISKGAANDRVPGDANDEVINDSNFSSTALFIALLIFAGIIVVEGSGCFFSSPGFH